MLGVVLAQTQRGNGVINVGRGGKVKERNKYRPGNLDQQRNCSIKPLNPRRNSVAWK